MSGTSIHAPGVPTPARGLAPRRAAHAGDGFRGTLARLRQALPTAWKVEASPASVPQRPLITIRSPDGRVAHLRVAARSRFEPRAVAGAVTGLGSPGTLRPLLVAALFLSPRSRDLLAAAGACYVDTTGNLRLVFERPPVFVERAGAAHDPAREPRPPRSLRGPTARRVVQALATFQTPLGVRELARRAAVAVASVSRVVTLIEREAIVIRDARGQILRIDRNAIRERSIEDAPTSAALA
jgi:hypothetical protein